MQVLIEHQASWPECEASLFKWREFNVHFMKILWFHLCSSCCSSVVNFPKGQGATQILQLWARPLPQLKRTPGFNLRQRLILISLYSIYITYTWSYFCKTSVYFLIFCLLSSLLLCFRCFLVMILIIQHVLSLFHIKRLPAVQSLPSKSFIVKQQQEVLIFSYSRNI